MPKLSGNFEHFTFKIKGVEQELKVYSFIGEESVSDLFKYDLNLVCEDPKLDFAAAVGKPGVLTFYDNDKNVERYVNGIVASFNQADEGNRLTTYKVTLRPSLWLFKHHFDCRIFQNMTIPDIIKTILDKGGIPSDRYNITVQAQYQPWEYCVQYRESDFDFIKRLMAQEGMFYFFEHSEDGHVLVIGDHISSYKPIQGNTNVLYHQPTGAEPTEDFISMFNYTEEVRSGAVSLTNYNFKKPALDLMSQNHFSLDQKLEVYDYPGVFYEQAEGKRYATVQMESWQVSRKVGNGKSNSMRIIPGHTFTQIKNTRDSFNRQYLITEVKTFGTQPQVLEEGGGGRGDEFSNFFNVIPSDVQFRSAVKNTKPRIDSIQTAIVVGPKGEEVYTDEHGRVKVHFHWDREGKRDENSSCWIRVSQLWAGEGWGAMWIPRIGHEVVVSFIEGDPDRPLITGRVYHGTNVPPYNLPAQKTKSTIKSNSSKGGKGYNEIRFEDLKGQEEVYVQAEKDWNILVKNDKGQDVGHDERLEVKHDRNKKVGNDQSEHIVGHKTIQVDKNHVEKIKKNMDMDVDENQSLRIKKDKAESIGKNSGLDIGDNYTIKVGKKTVLDTGNEIVIKCGKSSIVMQKNGDIQIMGSNLNIKMSGNIKMKGSKIAEN